LLAEPGTALASENFARLHGVGVGDVVELPGIRLRVVGVVPDYSWNRGTLVTDRLTTYVAAFGDPTADVFDVFVEPETTPARVKTAIEAGGTDLALGVLDRAEVHDLIVNVIRRPFSLALAQQAVLGLVAALGVVTALLISVLQRRRELGLLRAVGATRGQVVRTVLAEAMLMGLIGTALGVLVGLPLEWYVVRLVISEESGFAFPMAFPWSEGLVVGAAAVGLATLAGLLPALQAGRLNVVDAIAYE
jgi:putative ABC transport system permease protein